MQFTAVVLSGVGKRLLMKTNSIKGLLLLQSVLQNSLFRKKFLGIFHIINYRK